MTMSFRLWTSAIETCAVRMHDESGVLELQFPHVLVRTTPSAEEEELAIAILEAAQRCAVHEPPDADGDGFMGGGAHVALCLRGIDRRLHAAVLLAARILVNQYRYLLKWEAGGQAHPIGMLTPVCDLVYKAVEQYMQFVRCLPVSRLSDEGRREAVSAALQVMKRHCGRALHLVAAVGSCDVPDYVREQFYDGGSAPPWPETGYIPEGSARPHWLPTWM